MREIKFRVYDTELMDYASIECVFGFIVGHTSENIILGNKDGWSHLILEQYTGLKLHDVELYQGDIIQDTQSKNIYEIKNIDGGFCICPFKDKDWRFYDSIHDMQTKGWILEYGKIIGNIHENKELLK